MNFNQHWDLKDKHSFLSPSSYHWLNYDKDRLLSYYNAMQAKKQGTILHAFAKSCIDLGQRLPKSSKTLNTYVNDAIGYKMRAEQVLFYSFNCFGTADSISFRKNMLRIHDLKTGSTPASMKQVEIYMALFCLEYNHDPNDILAELRIYQSGEVLVENPDPVEIQKIMDTIVDFDKYLSEINTEEE